jgi:hypothetical protein
VDVLPGLFIAVFLLAFRQGLFPPRGNGYST